MAPSKVDKDEAAGHGSQGHGCQTYRRVGRIEGGIMSLLSAWNGSSSDDREPSRKAHLPFWMTDFLIYFPYRPLVLAKCRENEQKVQTTLLWS